MRPALVLVPQYFGSLVFERRSSRYLPFDQEATRVLERLCCEPVEAIPQFLDFYEHFYQRGFFRLDGRLDAERLELVPPPDHLAGPLAVHLEVTAACNLSCRHCFAGELPRAERPLSLQQLDELFATLARLGCFRLGLTGGEPLLRRDLLDILDAATARGLHPCLTTNGLLLDQRWARELGRRKLVWLNISLEGACDETTDAVRGPGTHERVLEKLEMLRQHARFTLAFTLTRANLGEISACAALARQVGAAAAVFRPLYPVGTARLHPELMLSLADYVEALGRLEGDVHATDPFSPQRRREIQARVYPGPGCGAAHLVCSVSVGGDVNPCSFLGPDYVAGNVQERPFREIWDSSWSFLRLRSQEGDFQGGCRARAQALAGSAQARDPWHEEALRRGWAHPCSNWES